MDRGDIYLWIEGEVGLLSGNECIELMKLGIASLRKLIPQMVSSSSEEADLSFTRRTAGKGVLWLKLS